MDDSQQQNRQGPTPVADRINTIGSDLARSFQLLLDGLPGRPTAAREMARTLSVDKILLHRLLGALRCKDPMATAHSIPGPEPLMRVVKAAKAKGAPLETVQRAEAAISSFRDLIKNEVGDRSGLDAIISTLLPDARGRFEMLAKRSVYRGISQLKGLSADVTFITALVGPCVQGGCADVAAIRGFLGLRCIRPGAELKIGVVSRTYNGDSAQLTLDGTPVTDLRRIVLPQFCSVLPADLQVFENEASVAVSLGWGNSAGTQTSCDVVTGEMRREAIRLHRAAEDTKKKSSMNDGVSVPTRMYLFDLLLHEEAYPNWEPNVRVIELGEMGASDINDASRDRDVIDLDVQVKPMGEGIERFRAKEIPNYTEMLEYMCSKMNVTPERLRGYRTRIEYPVFGTEVQFSFEPTIK